MLSLASFASCTVANSINANPRPCSFCLGIRTEMISPNVTKASSSAFSVVAGLRPATKMVFLLTEVESGSMMGMSAFIRKTEAYVGERGDGREPTRHLAKLIREQLGK